MRLHSAYNPGREVDQFLQQTPITGQTLVVLDGEGYLGREIFQRFPGVKLLHIFPLGKSQQPRIWESSAAWDPESPEPLEIFFTRNLDPLDFLQLQWITWPASQRLLGPHLQVWEESLRVLLRRDQGSFLTHRRFGPRWLFNTLHHLRLGTWEVFAPVDRGSFPLWIAASGPSLAQDLDLMKSHRNRFELWALASSLDYLFAQNLIPDFVVNTDGSFYAAENLFPVKGSRSRSLLALTAPPESFLPGNQKIFFSQGMAFEKPLFPEGTLPVPSRGTVAASALHLARIRTSGPIFISGLDFAWKGIQPHVRPHTWERRTQGQIQRFQSEETLLFRRCMEETTQSLPGAWRTNPALEAYAQDFQTPRGFPPPAFRVGGGPWNFPDFPFITPQEAQDQMAGFSPIQKLMPISQSHRPPSPGSLVESWKIPPQDQFFGPVNPGEWFFLANPEAHRQIRKNPHYPWEQDLENFLKKARQVAYG